MFAIRYYLLALLVFFSFLVGFSKLHADSVSSRAAPPRIVLVLDISGSMNDDDKILLLKGGVASMLAILPPEQEAAIVVFNHEATVLVPPTRLEKSARTKMIHKLHPVKAAGGTDILAGVARGLDLAGKGGIVLVLSDGAHNGQGTEPVPEAVWRKPARELVKRAREQEIVLHSLGLGVHADAQLLGRLAADTGGEYFSVPKPASLVEHFVQLASQLGRFWRRSQPGEFTLSETEDVISVTACGKEKPAAPLFRLASGRRLPVEAGFEVQYAGVCARRSSLQPGTYLFAPTAAGHADLLRPMRLAWQAPADKELPAHRRCLIALQASPIQPRVDVRGVRAIARREAGKDRPAVTVSATLGADGRVLLPLQTPATPGERLRVVLEAEQEGWTYRLGPWSVLLVNPPPIKVRLTRTAPAGKLAWVTPLRVREVVVEASAECSLPEIGARLRFAVVGSDLSISPSEVRLDRQRTPVRLVLTLPESPSAKQLSGELTASVVADDLAAPTINGRREESWAFEWKRITPSLRLSGLPGSTEVIRLTRGKPSVLPLQLEGHDLPQGSSAGMRLDTSRLPAGFEIDGLAKNAIVAVLTPGSSPGLRVQASRDVMPGRYTLPFVLHSMEADVLLNGRENQWQGQLAVEVAPVAVRVLRPTEQVPWVVRAPLAPVTREVIVEMEAMDGGILPVVDLKAATTSPVTILARGETRLALSRRLTKFELTVPAQSTPFQGEIELRAEGPVVLDKPIVQPVEVASIRVRVMPGVLATRRYPGFLEPLLGWSRPTESAPFTVTFTGAGWQEAGCSWSLEATSEDGSVTMWTPDADGRAQVSNGTWPPPHYLLRPQARYAPAVFEQGEALPIATEAVVETPWLALALCGAMILPVFLVLLLRWRTIRVMDEQGGICRGRWGRLALDRRTGEQGLYLRLRRGLFSIWLCRSRRDRSPARVQVLSRGEVLPGERISLAGGDVILVHGSEGTSQWELLNGRPGRAETPEAQAEFDDLNDPV